MKKYIDDNNLSGEIIMRYDNMVKWYDKYNITPIESRPLFLNLYEFDGCRICIKDIDDKVFLFIKELFHLECDGFIAPRLFSPFHMDYTSEELVIFDYEYRVLPYFTTDLNNINYGRKINDILNIDLEDQIIGEIPILTPQALKY